jgi:pimeloyl-ACP methyl ester carboxylesterase
MRSFVLFLGLVACGDNLHPPRLLMEVGPAAPEYGRAPFPTDAVREGGRLTRIEGLERVVGQHADLVAAHLEGLGGWGLRPTIEFFIQGPLDPATVPATTRTLTDALVVLDVDPATAEQLAPIPWDWRYDEVRGVIAGSPQLGVQLRENTRYAAVLTTDVRGLDNAPVFGTYSLGLLEQDPPERWQTTGQAYAELKVVPQLENRIAGLTVFTTQPASDLLIKARNVVANTGVVEAPVLAFDDDALIFDTPAKLDALLGVAARDIEGERAGLERWGSDNPTGIAHEHVAVVATGTTTIARFVRDDTGTDGPEDETFALGGGGVPEVRSLDTIPITFVLPKGPVPPAGFPVVVFGHGLGGSRHDVLAMAEPLASQGVAVVAIDMWNHGSRHNPTDTGNNLGSKPGFNGDRDLRDGFADDVGLSAYLDFFEGFMNFSAIRDSIRQSALDIARVSSLIQTNPDLSALAGPYGETPRLDPTRVAYLGESFGTIVGTAVAAIEPDIALYVLNGPGGGLVDYILPNSPSIATLALPFAEHIYRTTGRLDRFHPLVSLLQTVFDGADSLTFARRVLRDRARIANEVLGQRHVVCLQVMHDEAMPNVATEALARGFGMHVLQPNLGAPSGMLQIASPGSGNVNNQTAVLVQWQPATHGQNWSALTGTLSYRPGYPYPGVEPYPKLPHPITIHQPLYETHEQVAEILASHFAKQIPRVRSTKAPVADFDGDGVPDDIDPDPFDPNVP